MHRRNGESRSSPEAHSEGSGSFSGKLLTKRMQFHHKFLRSAKQDLCKTPIPQHKYLTRSRTCMENSDAHSMDLDHASLDVNYISSVPDDVFTYMLSYLGFCSIIRMTETSKLYISFRRRNLDACRRFEYEPRDYGMGIGLKLDLNREDWMQSVMAREFHANMFLKCQQISSQFEALLSNMYIYQNIFQMVEEGLRWIVYLNDENGSGNSCEAPLACIKMIANFARSHNTLPSIQQLAIKVLGILALEEHNRKRFAECQAVSVIMNALRRFESCPELVANCCWTIVIVARPLGALEGSTYQQHMESTVNVEEIVLQGGIQLVINAIETHAAVASTLAKAFWALVNLSLNDVHKAEIVRLGGIEKIIAAMRRFPLNMETQYRACFALINLAIKTEVKNTIRELGGVPLILDGMKEFPTNFNFQKTACIVIRSLAWNSDTNARLIRSLGGADRIRAMTTRFSDKSDIIRLGNTTLACINMFPP